MDTSKNNDNKSGTTQQQSSKPRRPSRAKKKKPEQEGEGEEELNEVERLVAKGWTKGNNITANKVFLSGQVIVEGLLHATDKLCLRGDFIVTEKLECEGNFTLSGDLWLWGGTAMVKNMIILKRTVIRGDVTVSTGAYIKGQCTIIGKLTVTGTLRLSGTLKCKRLSTTGPIRKYGRRPPKVIVEEEDTTKGEDVIAAELVHLLGGHETST
ncbi:hypothetical protein FHL15_004663 [Xylaria flabelliformis]|uniref:Polymer-forming cytoskeletal protein n=1 Tax=Xylaria flabelliformis TaxID=2512241 RepID=A0A553I2S6_9PEZI|nr:hypothetical protein FHL15_004663 [Xylaria flabelliformis]